MNGLTNCGWYKFVQRIVQYNQVGHGTEFCVLPLRT